MPQRFNARFTMFVLLRGHAALAAYFAVSDTLSAANDNSVQMNSDVADR